LRERLVADHPDAAEHRADLAALLTNLGPMLGEMGRAEEGMAHLRRAYDLRAKLAADQPAVTAYRTGLGNTAYQIGHQLQARVPAEALPWFDKAVAALGPVVKQDATQTLARNALRQASWERAEALGKLNRYAEAVADWRRAGDLSTPTDRAQFHLQAVYFQARGGDPAGATAAAEPLAADPAAAATTWYVLARVYALAAGAQEDAAARERHAARAVALLNRARAAGAFRKRAEVEQVKVLTDLEPLRQRDDFKQFLAGLEPARD
jgi:tetratricopeptide (TPR) repeat protein